MGIVPAEAYFPSSSLMGERIRGAQLASMEQNQAREEARMKGMMGALGVSSPEEAYEMKARQDIESQRLGDFEDFLTGADEIYETYGGDSEEFQGYKEAYKGIWSPYLADFNIAGPKGKDHDRILTITPTQDTPMEIAGKEVILKKGVTYEQGLKGPDAVWARELPKTQEAVAKKTKAKGEGALQWDKAAAQGLARMVGTTTASGIVIDEKRQTEYQLALSFLNKYRDKDINTAATQALQEAQGIVRQIPEGQEIAQIGTNKKTGKRVARLTDGTIMPLE
jgi:hypothetical protein